MSIVMSVLISFLVFNNNIDTGISVDSSIYIDIDVHYVFMCNHTLQRKLVVTVLDSV